MTFFQDPPQRENTFLSDRVLRRFLERNLPPEVRAEVEPELAEMGELAVGRLRSLAEEQRRGEPELVAFDPWGHRVDDIRVPEAWTVFGRVAAERGVVATAYERRHGPFSRVHQFALAYLFEPYTMVYNCPLAMTDGAARVLTEHGSADQRARALPRLTSRDPALTWTAGQWMTERGGGSDVGRSETVARRGEDGQWRLFGTKWFTSATTSDVALTLARPEGGAPGGRGLALFYLEQRDALGRRNRVLVNRLKEKLGTRMLPTAELTLDGALAEPVGPLEGGVKRITPLLNITRTWNAISSVALFGHGVALARDYAHRRVAFGAPLADKPLHLDTLAGLQAELEAGFHLTFHVVQLLGRVEAGEATDAERASLRLLTPICKLLTARQAVAGASEVLEAFGGAGYVEDTGLPRLLRDSQVLPIWEGTTNVLSLDAIRAVHREDALEPCLEHLDHLLRTTTQSEAMPCARAAVAAARAAALWLRETARRDRSASEAGARRFAMTFGRAMALGLLASHASWALETKADKRPLLAARRFLAAGVDLLDHGGLAPLEAATLALDEE